MLTIAALTLVGTAAVQADQPQIAGSTLVAVTAVELRTVTTGWSARRQILGQWVFNDSKQRIGAVDDIVISPDKAVSYAIIGAGGFLGLGKHDVVIPVSTIKQVDGKFILAGATRSALMAMPAFEYAH